MSKHNQLSCVSDRLRAGDTPLFHIAGQSVTINELHASALGLLGLPLGERGFAFHTIKHEPHYFVATFAIAYAIGRYLR